MAEDPFFGEPLIKVDEQREWPLPHRYVHGRFDKTETLFSFYFPKKEEWKGRLLHFLEGGQGGNVNLIASAKEARDTPGPTSAASLRFAAENGAFLVESNQGHVAARGNYASVDPTITGYRANAAVARFAKIAGEKVYGSPVKRAYLFGGSGGGLRTFLGMENIPNMWDGGIASVCGAGMGRVNLVALLADMQRILGPKYEAVLDAGEPGGADPFAGLNEAQAEIVERLYSNSIPRGAERSLADNGADLGLQLRRFLQSPLARDFWARPGHLGADGKMREEMVEGRAQIIRLVTVREIKSLMNARNTDGAMLAVVNGAYEALDSAGTYRVGPDTPIGAVLSGVNPERMKGAQIKLAGNRDVFVTGVLDNVLLGEVRHPYNPTAPNMGIARPGETASYDNRAYLAFCKSYLYPGRGQPSGPVPTGRFTGKLFHLNNAYDSVVPPSNAVAYQALVREQVGQRVSDKYRLWFLDKAVHVPLAQVAQGSAPVATTRLVSTEGALQQAVRDMIAWVESGREPPPNTEYKYDKGHFSLLPTAAAARGIQPVVTATVNSQSRIQVKANTQVSLEVDAEVPPGAGRIIRAEWDYDGSGEFPFLHEFDGRQPRIKLATMHAYPRPGTYFPSVRIIAHRDGDPKAETGRIEALGRVRVVVV